MRYKSKSNGYELLTEDELLQKLLESRGVKDYKHLLNVSSKDVYDGKLFVNMDKGLELLHKAIKLNKTIAVIQDCDVDGLCSSSNITYYIKDIDNGMKINIVFHEGKEHGIILKDLEDVEYDLLIVPDAGSSDVKQIKELKSQGKDILILDHHNYDTTIDTEAVIINCKDGAYPNPTLSGAGVTYKFCKEYDKKYNYNFADKYLDLVAVGNIADSMDLTNYETRYLTLEGLKILKEGNGNIMFQEILKKNNIENPTITDVNYKIAPFINASTRVGTLEEKMNLFKSVMGSDEKVEYQPRRKHKDDPKPPVEYVTIQKDMTRQLTNIKSRQDKLVKQGMEELINKIEKEKLDNNKIIIVDGTETIKQTFSGLVANKIADKYKRPALILREQNNYCYGGSGRNYKLFEIENLNNFLKEIDVFESVDGHDNAFGFKLKKERLDNLISLVNHELVNTKIDDTYHVDYSIPVGRLKEKHIKQVGRWEGIWGNNLSEPLFAITGIAITEEDISLLGEKKNVLKITKQIGSQNFSFIKLHSNIEEYNKIIGREMKGLKKKTKKRINMEIVGTFKINQFNGNEYPQINIIDYNISEVRKLEF